MREILADLVAEQQSLDQSLQRAPDRDWKQRVAGGVTVQDTIAILAWGEQHAARLVTGEIDMDDLLADFGDLETFEKAGVAEGKGHRPQEVIEMWRFARADVVDALSRMDEGDPVSWINGNISAQTFATIRLTDTWKHGMGILTALDKEIVDTARLRHVAWLGWASLPSAANAAGMEYPEEVRLELGGPSYARWVFGPEDADNVIRGPAVDWCRLAIRYTDDPGELTASGEIAAAALEFVDIYSYS
jgi:uncharacterized protein (TIGR03084 family)